MRFQQRLRIQSKTKEQFSKCISQIRGSSFSSGKNKIKRSIYENNAFPLDCTLQKKTLTQFLDSETEKLVSQVKMSKNHKKIIMQKRDQGIWQKVDNNAGGNILTRGNIYNWRLYNELLFLYLLCIITP